MYFLNLKILTWKNIIRWWVDGILWRNLYIIQIISWNYVLNWHLFGIFSKVLKILMFCSQLYINVDKMKRYCHSFFLFFFFFFEVHKKKTYIHWIIANSWTCLVGYVLQCTSTSLGQPYCFKTNFFKHEGWLLI